MDNYSVYIGTIRTPKGTQKTAGTEDRPSETTWMGWAGSTGKGSLYSQGYNIVKKDGGFQDKLAKLALDVEIYAQGRTIELLFPPFEFEKEGPGFHKELEFHFAQAKLDGTQKPTDAEIKQIQRALGIKK